MEKCSEVMTENPICCLPEDVVEKVAQMMNRENIGSIPVVENKKTKKMVGIVTDRDLALKIVAEGRDTKTTKVEMVMSRKLVTCRVEDDLQVAMNAMSAHQLRRIPVVDVNNMILGIIAQADLATRVDQPIEVAELVKNISQSKTKSSLGPVMKWLDPRKISLKQISIMIALLLLAAIVIAYTLITSRT